MTGIVLTEISLGAEWNIKRSSRDAQDIEMTFIYFSAPE